VDELLLTFLAFQLSELLVCTFEKLSGGDHSLGHAQTVTTNEITR
jgi:hypothetical protein